VRAALSLLSNTCELTFEDAEVLDRALSKGGHDPADMIIHALGQKHGWSETVTFDRRFARADGVRLLGA
jgi:predicted nucleic acid-binding protein